MIESHQTCVCFLRLSPWQGTFLNFFQQEGWKIINNLFFLNLFAPWQETFADARDGDGDGDGDWGDHFGIILGAC